jgi:nucleotide-binding universal stress UspA family protein
MGESILVPMDDSDPAEAALERAVERNPDAEITVLNVYGVGGASVADGAVIVMNDEVREAARHHAEDIFDRARELAVEAGHEGELETVAEEGDPKKVIPDRAAEHDAVYIGGHGRTGAARILLGSVAESVVRRSPVPVTVVK